MASSSAHNVSDKESEISSEGHAAMSTAGADDGSPGAPVGHPTSKGPLKCLALSRRQERMYFMQMANPDSRAFNLGLCITLKCKKPHEKLAPQFSDLVSKSIKTLIAHHPNLRFSIVDALDTPTQIGHVIQDVDSLQVCTVLSDQKREKSAIAIETDYTTFASREVDLSKQPFHCMLYTLSSSEAVIVFTFHHIVMDGTSLYIVTRDLIRLLSGRSLRPAVSSVQLGHTQPGHDRDGRGSNDSIVNEKAQRKIAKWVSLLSSAQKCTSFSKTADRSLSSDCVYLPILPTTSTAITSLTRLTNVSSVVVLSSMFVCALATYTHSTDLIIGMVSANRGRETKDIVNYFANTLPLRVNFNDESHSKNVATLLKHVKRNWSMVLDGTLDLADLLPHVKCLKHQGQSSATESPLQVLFSYYNITEENSLPTEIQVGGVEMTCSVHSPKSGHAHTDLVLEVDPTKHSSSGSQLFTWEYRKSALTKTQVECIHKLVCDFTEAASLSYTQDGSPLSLVSLSLDSDPLSQSGLSVLSGPEQINMESLKPDGTPLCYIERFNHTVLTSPQLPAFVLSNEDTLSYKQVDVLATKIALLLASRGVKPRDHIAIYMTRTHWLYVAILAVLKCACTYVPIDTTTTKDRGDKVLKLANAKLLVTESRLSSHYSDFAGGIVELNDVVYTLLLSNIDTCDHNQTLKEFSELNITYSPDQICFILFTSGTTGEPKGVALSEKNFHTTIDNLQSLFSPEETRFSLAAANVSFDGHVADSLFPLVNSSCLVVADNIMDLCDLNRAGANSALSRITYTFATPSSASVVPFPNTMKALKVGGEVFSRACFENTLHIPKVVNGYGPSETTAFVSTNQLPRSHEIRDSLTDEDIASIGTPVKNCKLMVLDEDRQAVPIGTPGVLHIAGPNVSDVGYYGRPDLTQKAFFPLKSCDTIPKSCDQETEHSASSEITSMVYCTGDMAKVLPNGKLQFLGRADDQVKLRGFRFHLLEVEQTLSQFEGVAMCVVFVKDPTTPSARLVACVTPGDIDVMKVREFAVKSLAKYKVPSLIVACNKFPLTKTGKVDKRKLEKIAEDSTIDSLSDKQSELPSATPQTSLLSEVAGSEVRSLSIALSQIFAKVLGVRDIKPDDDFFRNGGHSLLTFQLLKEVNRQTGATLSLTHILQHTTPLELASAILYQQEKTNELEDILDQQVPSSSPSQLTTPPQKEEAVSSDTIFDYLKPVPDVPLTEPLHKQLAQMFQSQSSLREIDPTSKLPPDLEDLEEMVQKLQLASGISISANALTNYSSMNMLQSHYKLKAILSFKSQPDTNSVVVLHPKQSSQDTPLFFIHAGIIGWAMSYHRLAQDIGVYSVAIQYTSAAPEDCFEEKACFYLKKVKSVQPKGPYKLIGLCYGALLVYEIARQLTDAGERVQLVVLINNSPLPECLPPLFTDGRPLQGIALHPYNFYQECLDLNFSGIECLSKFNESGVECEALVDCILSVFPWLTFTHEELVSAYLQFYLPTKAIWSGKYRPRRLVRGRVGSVVLIRDRLHPLFESHDYGLLQLVDGECLSVIIPPDDLAMLSDPTTRGHVTSIIELYL